MSYGHYSGLHQSELDAIMRVTENLMTATRKAALEEAAVIAEQHGNIVSNDTIGKACSSNIAAAIRKAAP